MVTSMTPNRVNIEQSASGNRKEEIFNLHTAAGKVEAGWVSVTTQYGEHNGRICGFSLISNTPSFLEDTNKRI